MLLILLACWRPEPYAAPAPAQVEASDVLEGTAGAIEPGGEAEAAEADIGEDAEAEVGEEPEAVVEPAPTDLAVEPWSARTSGRPLTLVGDDGSVVLVITEEGVAVTVLMEGPERLKVRYDGCQPPLEGWLQRRAVVR